MLVLQKMESKSVISVSGHSVQLACKRNDTILDHLIAVIAFSQCVHHSKSHDEMMCVGNVVWHTQLMTL